jgi:transcriptional regulator with XRE-family HTH domain
MTVVQLDSSQPPVSFAALLRQHRVRLGLTQAVLAERAGLSAHGIQKLERGAIQPYRDTADRLSRALQLSEQDAARFKAAARPLRRREKASLPAERRSPRHNPACSNDHICPARRRD